MLSEKEKLMANECSLTVSMIDSGFYALSEAEISRKGLYYQAFFSLSIGIERLLKIILITEYRTKNGGQFPDTNRIRKYGHRIVNLLKKVKIEFSDEIDKSIIHLLNDFATSSRYYNIDVMSTGNSSNKNPLSEWGKITNIIAERYKEYLLIPGNNKIFDDLNKRSVVIFHTLNGEVIDNVSDLYMESQIGPQVQSIALKHLFNIVVKIVEYLMEIRSMKYLLPDQLDFFGKYNVNTLEILEIEDIDWLSPSW